MSMMYKIFYGIMGAGVAGGIGFAFWATLFTGSPSNLGLYLGLSAAVGLIYGFTIYVTVKWVLRIFVNKFFTLERVLVGTDPKVLPNVLVSNEIDEMEASMVRISDAFSRLRTGKASGRSSRIQVRRTARVRGAGGATNGARTTAPPTATAAGRAARASAPGRQQVDPTAITARREVSS